MLIRLSKDEFELHPYILNWNLTRFINKLQRESESLKALRINSETPVIDTNIYRKIAPYF